MSQSPAASAQHRDVSGTKETAREAPAKVIPPATDPRVSTTVPIIEPIPTTPDTPAAVSEPAAAPIVDTTKPNPMSGIMPMIKSTQDFVAFGQANVEAFVKSSQIWATGVQELANLFAATTKASFDESVSNFTAISSAKSVTEAIDLQSKFAANVATKALAESGKLISASIKLTEQTLAPLTARATGAVETFAKAA